MGSAIDIELLGKNAVGKEFATLLTSFRFSRQIVVLCKERAYK